MTTPSDTLLKYMVALSNRNTESLGFIESTRMAKRIEKGQVLAEYDNGDLCGYLLHGCLGNWVHIHQACIQEDARRIDHGRALVARLAAKARRAGCMGISLRCRDNLPSNLFWQALGFEHVATVPGGRSRGRMINVWMLEFANAYELFQPSVAATSAERPSQCATLQTPQRHPTTLYLPDSPSILLPAATRTASPTILAPGSGPTSAPMVT